jgi:hypothetical protein
MTISRRDSLAPRAFHDCDLMPDMHPRNVRGKDDKNGTPDDLFYPEKPPKIILHSDNQWYIVVDGMYVFEIEFCPFCGCDLSAESKTDLKPPDPVNLGEEA